MIYEVAVLREGAVALTCRGEGDKVYTGWLLEISYGGGTRCCSGCDQFLQTSRKHS